MKVACYALAYNEEIILPQFIEHYKKFCDKIVIYDNMSTDNTKQIALDSGCEVISWEAPGGGLNDQCYLEIKQNCYKKDRDDYDWVISVDADEFYTHKEGIHGLQKLLEDYTRQGITLPKVIGYNMVGVGSEDLNISNINLGVEDISYSKRCIFNPTLNMSWAWGCHPQHGQELLNQVVGIKESKTSEVILHHYKYISLSYVLKRHQSYFSRLSSFNKERGLAVHYGYDEDVLRHEYNNLLRKAKVVK